MCLEPSVFSLATEMCKDLEVLILLIVLCVNIPNSLVSGKVMIIQTPNLDST